jgi:hypothetical protein
MASKANQFTRWDAHITFMEPPFTYWNGERIPNPLYKAPETAPKPAPTPEPKKE